MTYQEELINKSIDYEFNFEEEDVELLKEKSFLRTTSSNGDENIVIDQDYRNFRIIHDCCDFSKFLIEQKPNLVITVKTLPSSKFSVELNNDAYRLLKNIRGMRRLELLPRKELNPYLRLFITHFQDIDLNITSCRKIICSQFYAEEIGVLKNRLDSFFNESTSKEFKSKLHNFTKNFKDNKKSLNAYIDALFNAYSRLLVIRLDLSYYKSEVQRHKTLYSDIENNGFSVDNIISHRKYFVDMVRKEFCQGLKGFIWKLEHGQEKGYHYHIALFLDGNKFRGDIKIARMLGERWVKDITNGDGLYFNCNSNPERYRSKAVGMIHANDESAKIGMDNIVNYLTKMDLYIRLFLPDKARTFGKGGMPESSGFGRPRRFICASENTLSASENSPENG